VQVFLFYCLFRFILFLSFLPCSALGRSRTDRTLRKFTKVKYTNLGSNSVQNPYRNDPSVAAESVLAQIDLAMLYV
jgi:hypothetical protein